MLSVKEERIRLITKAYYSRQDVRKALLEFSKNRECIPRYFEGFGKRPDMFQYESDIFEQVKKGATSFHCSQELWKDPLEVSTDLNQLQLNELRIGWDLLLDIDSKYVDFSKIYTEILIDVLRFHGIKNIGAKFSGNKGFHILIPWKAFPKEIYGQETKNMFPEWPRLICSYLASLIQPKLEEKIFSDKTLKQMAEKLGHKEEDLIIKECNICNRPAEKKLLITWNCSYCQNQIQSIEGTFKTKPRCPDCRTELKEIAKQEIYFCNYCNIDSKRNPEFFNEKRIKTEHFIEADLILVSPRHLFRMPYSLHEKTALSSIVIDKNKIRDFEIQDALALKAKIKPFMPDSKENEAKNLLLQALDWKEHQTKNENKIRQYYQPTEQIIKPLNQQTNKSYKEIQISNLTPDLFPPCIKKILQGQKQDGRKRALFILLSFFRALKLPENEIKKYIEEWNSKNYQPLKQGYIQSQLIWYFRNQIRLPPNCDKTNYKDLDVCNPDEICRLIKNPVNYVLKSYFRKRR